MNCHYLCVVINSIIFLKANNIFDLLKAHLKRAPSLRGFALVRLASLKFQAEPWPPLIYNLSEAMTKIEEVNVVMT